MRANNEITAEGFELDYKLGEVQFNSLEQLLVDEIDSFTENDPKTINAVWISQDTPYANLIRTLEAERFPEMPSVMEHFEDQSKFLALVDVREESRGIVHAFRLTSKVLTQSQEDVEDSDSNEIGIALVDDLIDSGQGLTVDEVHEYYSSRGVDLSRCIAVESNFRVKKSETETGLRVSDLGYIALFQVIEKSGVADGRAAVFAHLNEPAVHSLGAIGLEYEPVAGREDLKTPTIDTDGTLGFDHKYSPVSIPTTPNNVKVFNDMALFAAPTYEL